MRTYDSIWGQQETQSWRPWTPFWVHCLSCCFWRLLISSTLSCSSDQFNWLAFTEQVSLSWQMVLPRPQFPRRKTQALSCVPGFPTGNCHSPFVWNQPPDSMLRSVGNTYSSPFSLESVCNPHALGFSGSILFPIQCSPGIVGSYWVGVGLGPT